MFEFMTNWNFAMNRNIQLKCKLKYLKTEELNHLAVSNCQ